MAVADEAVQRTSSGEIQTSPRSSSGSREDVTLLDKVNRTWRVLTVLTLLFGLFIWLAIWRYALLLPDDYFFSTRGGEPYGGITLAGLFESARIDLMERNGRIADVFVEIVLALPKTPARLLLGVLAWSPVPMLVFLARTIIPHGEHRSFKVFLTTLSVTFLPFFLIDTNPYWGASLFYFASAVVGYLAGMTLLFSAFALTIHLTSRYHHPSSADYLGLFLLTLLVSLFHEILAAAMLGVATMTTIFGIIERKDRTYGKPWFHLSACIVVPALISFLTPGMWKRKEVMDADESSVLKMLQEIPITVMQFGNRNLVIIVVFVALLAAVGAFWKVTTSSERILVRGGIPVVVFATLIWLASAFYNDTRFYAEPLKIASSFSAFIGTIFAVTAIVLSLLIIVVFVRCSPVKTGTFLLMTFAAFAVTFVFTSLTGSSVARAGFIPTALFYNATLALAIHSLSVDRQSKDLLKTQASFAVLAGVSLTFLFVAVPRASSDFLDVRANAKVWNASIDVIKESNDSSEDVTILLPDSLPRPSVVSWRELGHNGGVAYRLGIYYDLPDNVTIEWP